MITREWKLLSESQSKPTLKKRTKYFKYLNLTLVHYIVITKLVYLNFKFPPFDNTLIIFSMLISQLKNLKFISNQSIAANYYKSLHRIKHSTHIRVPMSAQLRPTLANQSTILRIFKVYTVGALLSDTSLFKAHASWKPLFMGPNVGVHYLNMLRLFQKFKLFIHLITSLFFFKISTLFLGSLYFKDEAAAINWGYFKLSPQLWRYVYPFVMLKPNRIFNDGWMIFYKLKLNGYKAAFVLDASYHAKTLYYLDRAGYYTVGGVPLWYNSRKVNFAIPISDDSVIMQLFLYRTVVLIRRRVEEQRYYSLLNYWNMFQIFV